MHPLQVLNTAIYTVNRSLLAVSAIIVIFGSSSPFKAPERDDLVQLKATMCGNLAIGNQILTQFRLSNVAIRT